MIISWEDMRYFLVDTYRKSHIYEIISLFFLGRLRPPNAQGPTVVLIKLGIKLGINPLLQLECLRYANQTSYNY